MPLPNTLSATFSQRPVDRGAMDVLERVQCAPTMVISGFTGVHRDDAFQWPLRSQYLPSKNSKYYS